MPSPLMLNVMVLEMENVQLQPILVLEHRPTWSAGLSAGPAAVMERNARMGRKMYIMPQFYLGSPII